MTATGSWSTQELTEFLARLSTLGDEAAVLRSAAERAAEAVDAEVGAIVADGKLASCTGFPKGAAPVEALLAIARGELNELDIPGVGVGSAVVIPLEETLVGGLIVARIGVDGFTLDEMILLRGMSRVLTLTVRMLRLIEAERGLRTESERQARDKAELLSSIRDRQRLLEAIADIHRAISHRRPLEEILNGITAAAHDVLHAEVVGLRIVDPEDPSSTMLLSHIGLDPEVAASMRRARIRQGVGGLAILEDRLIVIEDYSNSLDAVPALIDRSDPVQAAMGAPVRENGVVVGSLSIASTEPGRTYGHAERMGLLAFAEQASIAITDARTVAAMHEALHDPLTGLPNRAMFMERLGARLEGGERSVEGAVLFLDLDRFKNVNDSLGHSAGDELLVEVARRLQSCLRPSDTVARLGGDEFTVMLDEVSGVDEAMLIAKRLLDAIRQPFTLSGRVVFVTGSVGVVLAQAGRDEVEEVLRGADLAMYQAKGSGGAKAQIFYAELNEQAVKRIELESELRNAVEHRHFRLCFQPIVDLEVGQITGFEALVRWEHESGATVLPSDFIALAEETGLIVPLGSWVLEEACRQAQAWSGVDPSLEIHVNLSVRQFQQPGLVEFVAFILAATGLHPSRLTLEITESVLMQDADTTISRLAELRAIGVKLAIDDFGTGYSSLSYLKRFPVDVVKIDRSFISTLGEAPQDAAFARAIIELARTLHLRTVAEGVETERQLEVLRDLGCPEAQGYLFDRPLPAEDVTKLLARRGSYPVPGKAADRGTVPIPRAALQAFRRPAVTLDSRRRGIEAARAAHVVQPD